MAEKVAIVGGSPSTQMDAPFDDESYDIWVLGNQLDQYKDKRVTRVFEIHDNLSEHPPEYPTWLADKHIPLVVSENFPFHGNYISVFDKEAAASILGQPMLSSSPAYMLSQAILEMYTTVDIYGVDMSVDNHEYFKQRPDMYALIGYAKANGIEVNIPNSSTLFKSNYDEGRDWNNEAHRGAFSSDELEKLAEMHRVKVAEYERLIQSHDGARQAYERLAMVAKRIESGIEINTLTETVRIP